MAETEIDQASARPIRPGPHEAKPPPARRRRPPAARVALIHGAYLVGGGLWPILDLRSFMMATGPKVEGWLPKGVGVCMANIGAALAAAGVRGKVARELRILGVTTALSLAAIDFWYSGVRRRPSRVYLFIDHAQLVLAAARTLAD